MAPLIDQPSSYTCVAEMHLSAAAENGNLFKDLFFFLSGHVQLSPRAYDLSTVIIHPRNLYDIVAMGENGGGDAVASVVNTILNVSSGGPANVELLDRTVDSFYTAVSNEQV